MFRIFIISSIFFINIVWLSGQCIVRGKITEESGETLIGVTIRLESDNNVGTVSDYDGNFSLEVPCDSVKLILEYIGYETINEKIAFQGEKILVKDFIMTIPTQAIQEVVITARQERAKTTYMENIKKRSALTLDYVSSESMKKIGDSNVNSAITRVSGVSTNGSFITVRGIGDRYILTAVNGSQIPTLDPFTNNIKLDIIPSNLVDNVIVAKTASPELPGDWTGAYISVETKDYPEKFNLVFESQIGYNKNSSFKNIIGNNTSTTDWLGFDNGYRDRDHFNFKNYKLDPTDYELFMALGLGNFYEKAGITKEWSGLPPLVIEDYINLSLVELGLLSKSQLKNPNDIKESRQKFIDEGYRDKAMRAINQNAINANKQYPNNWSTVKKRSSTNISNNLSLGNQTQLFGKSLGYIIGLRYTQNIQHDEKSPTNRTFSSILNDGKPAVVEEAINNVARYTNGWSALLNVAYKYHANHSFSFIFMPNFIGVNNIREGYTYAPGANYTTIFGSNQFYEQRKQLIYQAKSEHYFPKSKLKVEANASYARGKSVAPDFKRFRFFEFDSVTFYYEGPAFVDDPLTRDFRYLTENLLDSKINFELPINADPIKSKKIKFGGALKQLTKKYDQYNYGVNFDQGLPYVKDKKLDDFFDLSNFDFQEQGHRANMFYGNPDFDPNHTEGISRISAAYAMIDFNFTTKLRLSGGLRGEYTDLYVDADKYRRLNLKRNDVRRIYEGALISNPGILKSFNLLPSFNFIYRIKEDPIHPINLRLNFSKTLARPSLREYSESIVYDYEYRADVFGNSDLKLVNVTNYDLRLESFFPTGDNVSLSFFYKDFKNHIELIYLNSGFSWSNSDKSSVIGVELEGKKKIGSNFEFTSNISLVRSKSRVVGYNLLLDVPTGIQIWNPIDTFTRVMFGQSPVVLNAMISYNFDKAGLQASLAYNVQAPRLTIQGARDLEDLSKNVPDIYEMPRHLVDFRISKTLNKRFNVNLNIRDLLNSPIRRSYKYTDSKGNNIGYLLDFDKMTFGTNFLLSFTYKI